MRYHIEIHDDNIQSKDEVTDGHNRYHDTAHIGNAPNAAKSDEQGNRSDNAAYHQRIEAKSFIQCATDGVALDRIIGETESERDEHGE